MVEVRRVRVNKLPEREFFEEWLINEKKMSSKVSKDICSRVNRIKSDIDERLESSLSSKENYAQLMPRIQKYAKECSKNNKSERVLLHTLMYAVRYYAFYLHGESAQELIKVK